MLAHVNEVEAPGHVLALNNSTKVLAVVIVGVAEVIVVLIETECEAAGTWNLYQTSLLLEHPPVIASAVAL